MSFSGIREHQKASKSHPSLTAVDANKNHAEAGSAKKKKRVSLAGVLKGVPAAHISTTETRAALRNMLNISNSSGKVI